MANYGSILNGLDVSADALAATLAEQKKAEKRGAAPLSMTEFKSPDNKVTYVDFQARSIAAKQAQQVQQTAQAQQTAPTENNDALPRNQFNPQPSFGKRPLSKEQLEAKMAPTVFQAQPAPSTPGFRV